MSDQPTCLACDTPCTWAELNEYGVCDACFAEWADAADELIQLDIPRHV